MNDAIKKRLVGVAVILIFAGLLWPILFDFDESVQPFSGDIQIPEKPDLVFDEAALGEATVNTKPQVKEKEVVLAEPKAKPAAQTPIADLSKALVKKKTEPKLSQAKASNERPKLDEHRIPVSYVVQTGTFNSWKNADALRNKLISKGLKAYTRPETSIQKGPYMVAVGPFLMRSKAEQAAATIKQTFNLNDAIIRRFRDL